MFHLVAFSLQITGISVLFKGKLKLVPGVHWQPFIHVVAQISLQHCTSGFIVYIMHSKIGLGTWYKNVLHYVDKDKCEVLSSHSHSYARREVRISLLQINNTLKL